MRNSLPPPEIDSGRDATAAVSGSSLLRVAILGSRGIPARYSGYDTLAEELSLGLVQSCSADVLVYCRSNYYRERPTSWKGVQLVYLPAPRLRALESLLHSFLSSLHVLRQKTDIIYFLDPANAPFCALLRLFGKRVVIHTDGLGWKRRKWGPLARRYYKLVEWVCSRCASALVTDNPAMQDYYRNEYGADSVYIPYGAASHYGVDESVYDELSLTPGAYLLVVARLEPENNTDFLIEEYNRTAIKMPLLVVGDCPYSPHFGRRLQTLANERVLFAGRVNDQAKLNALYKGAYLYLHGHEVGGTNPSLLRAMQAGRAPVVIDVPFNTHVIGDSGFTFPRTTGGLSGLLECLVADPAQVEQAGRSARLRADSEFSWDAVVQEHAHLFQGLTKPGIGSAGRGD